MPEPLELLHPGQRAGAGGMMRPIAPIRSMTPPRGSTFFRSTSKLDSAKVPDAGTPSFIRIHKQYDQQTFIMEYQFIRVDPSAADFCLAHRGTAGPGAGPRSGEIWQMLGLYTLPSHRAKGLGRRLCRTACASVISRRGLAPTMTVRCMVKPDHPATLRMYAALGFEQTGRCALEEASRANGEAGAIPEVLDEKHTTRTGIIMAFTARRQMRG